ncbi:MAG: hypothetical protein ACLQU9_06850 [Acidimicrobiales bacterium]|jgi:hypothetical protein
MFEMAMITVIVGSVGLLVAGSVAWYTIWRHRVAASFERVPVRTGRSVRVEREGDARDGME